MDHLHLTGGVLVLAGVSLTLIGTIGLLRFGDVFARSHATSLSDTFAALLVVLGLACLTTSVIVGFKLVMLLLFLLLSSPTATHALAQAALHDGHLPEESS